MENEVRGGEREEERDEEEREAVTDDDSDDLNTQLNEQERLMASFRPQLPFPEISQNNDSFYPFQQNYNSNDVAIPQAYKQNSLPMSTGLLEILSRQTPKLESNHINDNDTRPKENREMYNAVQNAFSARDMRPHLEVLRTIPPQCSLHLSPHSLQGHFYPPVTIMPYDGVCNDTTPRQNLDDIKVLMAAKTTAVTTLACDGAPRSQHHQRDCAKLKIKLKHSKRPIMLV